MNEEQIGYLSSLRRGYAAAYAEGVNRPKCVKLPQIRSFYDKQRTEALSEVRARVQDIVAGYDKKTEYHAGCSYCEARCSCYGKMKAYMDEHVAVDKALEKWSARDYVPSVLHAFMKSQLMRGFGSENMFSDICCIGYILRQERGLNDEQCQQMLASYLRYIYTLRRI